MLILCLRVWCPLYLCVDDSKYAIKYSALFVLLMLLCMHLSNSSFILSNSYMRSCQRTVLIILWSFGVWSKLERWRKLVSGSLMSWPKPKKIIVLKCDLLFYIMTTNHSLIIYNTYVHIPRSHVTKIGLYMTTGSNQFSGWTDKKLQRTSKAKLAPKNGHGLSFVVCCQFDALQLSASQWNHCIWEVCSANGWDALKTATLAASIGQQKGLNSP